MVSGKIAPALICFIFISGSLFGQVNRYMVFFKDKSGSQYSVNNPSAFLSQKAIDRRIKQGVSVNTLDLPVNVNYVEGVSSTGAKVFYRSRWFNGVLVQCDQSLISAIQALSYVDRVELVAPDTKLLNGGRKSTTHKKKNTAEGVQTQGQLSMLGIPEMHAAGYTGEGMLIAIFDSGFSGVDTTDPFQYLISNNRIASISHDFVFNSTNVFQYDDHGTEVLSIIAGDIPDVFTGGAYGASFQLYVTEDVDTEYRIEEYNWLFAAERADSAGADIIQSSLGYYDFDDPSMNYGKDQMDGKTAVATWAAQLAADRGIAVVVSAGNEGTVASWRIIAAPADAVDVLAVANVDIAGNRSPSSSIGPSADGRIKPDVAALGTGVKIVRANGTVSTGSGTSFSAPLVTSLVAGLWQRFPYLSNKELLGLVRSTASRSSDPNNQIGYGIPNYVSAENFQSKEEREKIFKIFPNPVIDTITIGPINPEVVGACRIELISSQGQLLGEETFMFDLLSNRYQAKVSHLAAGMYYLRLWFGGKRYLFKVVKV